MLSYLFQDDQNMTIPQFIEREIIYRALFRLQEDFEVSIDQLSKLFGFAHVSDSIIFLGSLSLLVSRPPGVYEGISGGRLARLSPLSPRWHMICSFIFYLPLILSNDQAVPGLVLPKNSPSPADWPGRLFFYMMQNKSLKVDESVVQMVNSGMQMLDSNMQMVVARTQREDSQNQTRNFRVTDKKNHIKEIKNDFFKKNNQ